MPYPHAAADHQRANAEWMAEGGGAVVVDDANLDGATLTATASGLLEDPDRLRAMAAASAALARPDAAERVASEILAACHERGARAKEV